jgi:hypothetical protein
MMRGRNNQSSWGSWIDGAYVSLRKRKERTKEGKNESRKERKINKDKEKQRNEKQIQKHKQAKQRRKLSKVRECLDIAWRLSPRASG